LAPDTGFVPLFVAHCADLFSAPVTQAADRNRIVSVCCLFWLIWRVAGALGRTASAAAFSIAKLVKNQFCGRFTFGAR
jgi:hypothetical protein